MAVNQEGKESITIIANNSRLLCDRPSKNKSLRDDNNKQFTRSFDCVTRKFQSERLAENIKHARHRRQCTFTPVSDQSG